jgi:hypothetical protein
MFVSAIADNTHVSLFFSLFTALAELYSVADLLFRCKVMENRRKKLGDLLEGIS